MCDDLISDLKSKIQVAQFKCRAPTRCFGEQWRNHSLPCASSAKTLNPPQLFLANCVCLKWIPQLLPLTTIVLVNLCYAWLRRQINRIQSLSPLGHQFKRSPCSQGPKVAINRWLFGLLSKLPFRLHKPVCIPHPKSCITLKGSAMETENGIPVLILKQLSPKNIEYPHLLLPFL